MRNWIILFVLIAVSVYGQSNVYVTGRVKHDGGRIIPGAPGRVIMYWTDPHAGYLSSHYNMESNTATGTVDAQGKAAQWDFKPNAATGPTPVQIYTNMFGRAETIMQADGANDYLRAAGDNWQGWNANFGTIIFWMYHDYASAASCHAKHMLSHSASTPANSWLKIGSVQETLNAPPGTGTSYPFTQSWALNSVEMSKGTLNGTRLYTVNAATNDYIDYVPTNWYQVAISWTNGFEELMLNGVVVDHATNSPNFAGLVAANWNRVWHFNNAGTYAKGYMDDFRCYTGIVLTAEQVLAKRLPTHPENNYEARP